MLLSFVVDCAVGGGLCRGRAVFASRRGAVHPHLGPYHTEATYPLDLGIIPVATYLAGIWIWQRKALGTLLACVMLTLNATIGLVVAGQSLLQFLDGIVLSIGEYATYVAPFVVLSLIALALLISLLRNISE